MSRTLFLELRRLLKSRFALAVSAFSMLSPLAGLLIYHPVSGGASTMYGRYLGDPAMAGGLLGALLFGFLALWEADCVERHNVSALVYAIVSPHAAALARLLALLGASFLLQLVTMLVWLPYTAYKLGALFNLSLYVNIYVTLMYGPFPLAILLSLSAYQVSRRLDVSLIAVVLLAALSLTVGQENWQLCWLTPCVWALSDDFSNMRVLRSVQYMRFTWLLGLSALWMLSFLVIRRNGKNALRSFLHNVRRIHRPLLMAALVLLCAVLYVKQPFVDHSAEEMDMDFLEPRMLSDVFCVSRYADVRPNPQSGELYGTATFQLENQSGQARDVRFLINPGYRIAAVRANGENIPFTLNEEEQLNYRLFTATIPDARAVELTIEYGGFPQEWVILSSMQGNLEISRQYMQLENEVLAPSPYDIDYRDASLPAVMDITLPNSMIPVLFGTGDETLLRQNDDGTNTWRLQSEGYRMIVYAGDYVCENVDTGEMLIRFFYGRRHASVMEQTDAAQLIRQVVTYCTEHYGTPGFSAAGSLKLIESRVSDSGYAVDGASLASEKDFTVDNLNSPEKGGAPAEVMIHELVHQWWGLGVMFDPTDDELFTAEGLTCYTTYRIVKALYGEEVAQAHYVDAWRQSYSDIRLNYYMRHPQALDALPETYQFEIANALNSVRKYAEMPLKLLKAEQLVGGEAEMDRILYGLFNRVPDPLFSYLTYQDFLDACNLTEEDVNLDNDLWL